MTWHWIRGDSHPVQHLSQLSAVKIPTMDYQLKDGTQQTVVLPSGKGGDQTAPTRTTKVEESYDLN